MPRRRNKNTRKNPPKPARARRQTKGSGPISFKERLRKETRGKIFAPAGAALGSMAGATLGSPVIGGMLGRRAGEWLAQISGFGDYTVRQNSLLSQNVPRFGASTFRLKHREFITDLTSPGPDFNSTTYLIQPTNELLFPWGSNIMRQYSEYKIKGMVFQFKSNSATAIGSTSTGLGTVVMATQYDVLHTNFHDKKEMEAHEFCVSGKPSDDILHPVECDPSKSPLDTLYIQDATVELKSDQRFHDFAKFTVATVGQQSPANLGELWVSYDIELSKPRLDLAPGAVISKFSCKPNSDSFLGSPETFPAPYSGNSPYVVVDLSGPTSLSNPEIRFYKSGRYIITQSASGSFGAGAVSAGSGSGSGSMVPVPWYYDSSQTQAFSATSSVLTCMSAWDVTVGHGEHAGMFPLRSASVTSYTKACITIIEVPRDFGRNPPLEVSMDPAIRRALEDLRPQRNAMCVTKRATSHSIHSKLEDLELEHKERIPDPPSPTVSYRSFKVL